jgi:hypothetical protein
VVSGSDEGGVFVWRAGSARVARVLSPRAHRPRGRRDDERSESSGDDGDDEEDEGRRRGGGGLQSGGGRRGQQGPGDEDDDDEGLDDDDSDEESDESDDDSDEGGVGGGPFGGLGGLFRLGGGGGGGDDDDEEWPAGGGEGRPAGSGAGAGARAAAAARVERLGAEMALITTLVRLLELKVVELEGEEEGTGPLEGDEVRLEEQGGGRLAPWLRSCLLYRAGQKRLARGWLAAARRELQETLGALRAAEEAERGTGEAEDTSGVAPVAAAAATAG